MSTPDSPMPHERTVPVGDASKPASQATAQAARSSAATESGMGRLAACGGVGAVMIWVVLLGYGYPFFLDPHVQAPSGGGTLILSPEERESMIRRTYYNATTLVGLCGCVFGIVLAAGDGVQRRSLAQLGLAVLLTAVLGGAAGSAAGWCAHWIYDSGGLSNIDKIFPSGRDLVIHSICWILTGMGIGLGLAVGARRGVRAIFGGAVGGLLGAMIYAIAVAVVGIIHPSGETVGLFPVSLLNRLLWLATAGVSIGAAIGGTRVSPSPVSGN